MLSFIQVTDIILLRYSRSMKLMVRSEKYFVELIYTFQPQLLLTIMFFFNIGISYENFIIVGFVSFKIYLIS